jgi:hypothetical protein
MGFASRHAMFKSIAVAMQRFAQHDRCVPTKLLILSQLMFGIQGAL